MPGASLWGRLVARQLARGEAMRHDLTWALDDYRGHAYLDWHHLSGEANEVVAQAMIRTLGTQVVRSGP